MSKSLLVVDDSATIREAVRHALAGEDWTVVIASSPSEALEIFRDRSFDAVLCDVSLRDADGYEMCRTLRTADGAGEPSIILMGAKVNDTAAMAAGASGTLLKPFESQEILEALEGMPDRDEAFVELEENAIAEGAPATLGAFDAGVSTSPLDADETVEIIDLSDGEDFADLEILEGLEPIEPGAREAALPETGSVSALEGATQLPTEILELGPGTAFDLGNDAVPAARAESGAEGGEPALEINELPVMEEIDTLLGAMGPDQPLAAATDAEVAASEEEILPEALEDLGAAPLEPGFGATPTGDPTNAGEPPREIPALDTPPSDAAADGDSLFDSMLGEAESGSDFDTLDLQSDSVAEAFGPAHNLELEQASTPAEIDWEQTSVEPAGEKIAPVALDELDEFELEVETPLTPTEPPPTSLFETEAPRDEPQWADATEADEPGPPESLPPVDTRLAPRAEDQTAVASNSDVGIPEALSRDVAAATESVVREALETGLASEKLAPVVTAVVERVVWEVVPQLAERLIQEAIEKIQSENPLD